MRPRRRRTGQAGESTTSRSRAASPPTTTGPSFLSAPRRPISRRSRAKPGRAWPTVPPLGTAEDAARAALDVAADEDAALVLFSPACASFDRYPNFETRALAFREAIRAVARHAEPTEPG